MAFLPKDEFDFQPYDFHKSKDGEDCIEKIYYYTKYSGTGGAIFSFYEMVFKSKPATVYGVLGRFGRFTFPFAAMGCAFGTSLCLLGKLRKKTDVMNHAIAGAAAGGVLGAKFNSVSLGHTWAVIFAISAAYYMYFKVNNLPMLVINDENRRRTNLWNLDFTIKLYEDPGRPEEM